jgi:hypothetical protein
VCKRIAGNGVLVWVAVVSYLNGIDQRVARQQLCKHCSTPINR